MANRLTYFRKVIGREQFAITCTMSGNGAANPTVIYGLGRGIKSIVRTGVGAFTINLEDNWSGNLVAFRFDYGDSNYATVATRKRVVFTGSDVLVAKTVTVQVEDATSGTNAASDLTATQLVSFELIVRNTKDV